MRYTISIGVFDLDAHLATANTRRTWNAITTMDELLRHAGRTIDVGGCLIAGESPPGVEIEHTSATEAVD